jgi:hypothetical protein
MHRTNLQRTEIMRYLLSFVAIFALSFGFGWAYAADKAATKPVIDEQLKTLQDFVGHWKGAGFVRRGSAQGGWIEAADWRWDFEGGTSSLLFNAPQAKYLTMGKITSSPLGAKAPAEAAFKLTATTADKQEATYVGGLKDDGSLVFTSDYVPASAPTRVTLRFAAEKKRLVVLLERHAGGDSYNRLGEIGYTREGSGFGEGKFQPECVVTGGIGTMTIGYKGKTYYVCCTGCKDLFESDPETYVAEYEARLKKGK